MKKAKLNVQHKEEKKAEEFNPFSWKKLIIFLFVIVAILVGFYFLTDRIVEKNTEDTEEETKINERANNNIDYNDVKEIKEKNYYLMFYKEDDENNATYDIYVNSLKANNIGDKVYYINLDKESNKNVVDSKSSLKELDKLKVNGSTLVHVEDGKIKETFEGGEKILAHLGSYFNITTESSKESNSNSNSNSSKK